MHLTAFYHVIIVFLCHMISTIESYANKSHRIDIPLAIVNVRTVLSCGHSIRIYSLFDRSQLLRCPHVAMDERRFQLIDMNLSKFD
jgi:hypothetical protein